MKKIFTLVVAALFGMAVSAEKALYMVPGAWSVDSAAIYAWVWSDGVEGAWYFMAGEGDTLVAQIPDSASKVKFVRFNPEADSIPTWSDSKEVIWNQTGDQVIDSCGLFIVNDWDNYTWCEPAAVDTVVEPVVEPEEMKALSMIPGVWTADSAAIYAWAWGADFNGDWYFMAGEGETLVAQIPVAATQVKFVRFNPEADSIPAWSEAEGVIWNQTPDQEIDSCGLFIVVDWDNYTWCAAEGDTVVEQGLTCAQAAEWALSVANNNDFYNNGEEYEVEGFVTNIAFAWKSGNMSFWMADTENGGNVIEAYKCAVAEEANAPKVGDKVKVAGKLTKFNSTPEFAEGCTCEIIARASAPANLGEKTIAEFLALKNAKDTCILRGAVANIVMDKNDATKPNAYGNFDLVDATGSVYVYGLLTPAGESKKFIEMNIKEGDTITIKAIYTEYNGQPQAKNAILVAEGEEEPEVVLPELPEGVITCDSAVVLAASIQDPAEVNATVEGMEVKIRGFVIMTWDPKDGAQSAWLSDDKNAKGGVLQGYKLAVTEAVAKGDYVQIEGKLAKYLKAGKDNNPAEVVIEVVSGTMAKVDLGEGIENVVLTEKAQKVMIDGVLYIIRDNKMYNIQGVQVR